MKIRSFAFATLALASIVTATSASAQPERPFSLAALKAAQAKGQSVLVDAYAPWCPICRAQAPTVAALTTDPAYKNLQVLRLDYDHQSEEKKALGIRQQSTLIAYRGGKEVGRLVGVTDPTQIRKLAASTLK